MLPFSLVYHEGFYLPFGKAHVFPGVKYKLIRERLLETRAASDSDFVAAQPIAIEDVLRVHEAGFVDRLIHGTLAESEIRRMELPYSKELVQATLLGCGGTLEAARLSLRDGVACSIGGGFHHAHADHGEGFCMLNDVAIALARLLHEGTVQQAMVVDLDVHDGNGTAAIFPPHGVLRPSIHGVFTLSMHQENNYPAFKPPSSLDVPLRDRTGDEEYLEALEAALAKAFSEFRPQIVAYVAGSDPYVEDKLGGLALSMDGLKERDRMVFRAAQSSGASVFSVFAGGYAYKLDDTVTIHTNTVLAAAEVFSFHGATSC